MKKQNESAARDHSKPVSLHGPKLEDVLRAVMQVKPPEDKPKRPGRAKGKQTPKKGK